VKVRGLLVGPLLAAQPSLLSLLHLPVAVSEVGRHLQGSAGKHGLKGLRAKAHMGFVL
jgi:hypothetical protein